MNAAKILDCSAANLNLRCRPGLLQAKARCSLESMEFNLLASLRQRFAELSNQRRLCQLEQTQSHSSNLLAPTGEPQAEQPTARMADYQVTAQETTLAKSHMPHDCSTNTPALMANPHSVLTSQPQPANLCQQAVHHTQRQRTFKAKSKIPLPRVKFKHPHSPAFFM